MVVGAAVVAGAVVVDDDFADELHAPSATRSPVAANTMKGLVIWFAPSRGYHGTGSTASA